MATRLRNRSAVPLLALCLSLASATPATAQTTLTEHTLTASEGHPPPAARIDDLTWLTGRWIGEGLGARVEESWLPPTGGSMVGIFRLVREGHPELYEMVTLEEKAGSLTMRLKHFAPDFVGWEARDETVDFLLLQRKDDTFWFDGLTLHRMGPDTLHIWVALTAGDGTTTEELFEYRRVGP